MSSETDGFFQRGGSPALSFHDDLNYYAWRGIVRGGVIIAEPDLRNVVDLETKQPKLWDDGSNRKKMVITMECAGAAFTMPDGTPVTAHDERDRSNPKDRGYRRLFVQGFMVDAVRTAIQAVGAKGVSIGGRLYLAWTDEKPPNGPGRKPGKLYTAVYFVPEVAVPAGGGAPPQNGLSGAPSTPFGGPQQAPPAQAPQPAPAFSGAGAPPPFQAAQQPAPIQAGPAFGAAVQQGQQQAAQTVAALQQAGYQGPAYEPPAPPVQQPPAVGTVAPDGSAMWNGQVWIPIPGQHVADPPAAPFGGGQPAQQPPAPQPTPPPGFQSPFTGQPR